MKKKLDEFPEQVLNKLLHYQSIQGNKPDLNIFEEQIGANKEGGGFDWEVTEEGGHFWREVLLYKNFKIFFDKYPLFPTNTSSISQQELKTMPNLPAFGSSEAYGLTKREYFAAAALQGLLSNSNHDEIVQEQWKSLPDVAVLMANTLIESLNIVGNESI